jgi:hypothetical protein
MSICVFKMLFLSAFFFPHETDHELHIIITVLIILYYITHTLYKLDTACILYPLCCVVHYGIFINIGRVKEKENCVYMGLVKQNG